MSGEYKFVVGCTVERIMGSFEGMHVGDRDIVDRICPGDDGLDLKKYGLGHDHGNFKVVSSINWKRRLQCQKRRN